MHDYPDEVLRVQWVARYQGEIVRFNLRAFSQVSDPQDHYLAAVTIDDWDDPILTGVVIPANTDEPMRFLEDASAGRDGSGIHAETLRFPIHEESLRCDAYEWETAKKAAELTQSPRGASKEPRAEALASLRKQHGSWSASVISDIHNCCGLSATVRDAFRLKGGEAVH